MRFMQEQLKIREDFKALIPPLSEDERQCLEDSILEYGCRDALLTWSGWIIDGHNRYEICEGNGIEYRTQEVEFEDEGAVKIWMIRNQFGRRNLDAYTRAKLAIELKGLFAAKAKENLKIYGGNQYEDAPLQKSANVQKIDTRQELARIAGTSHDTIAKVERIERDATPEIKAALSRQDISINQAYQEVKQEEKKEKKQEERRVLAEEGAKKEIEIDFRLGDFEDVFIDIEDGSVDCIITDPPYPYEFIDCWTKLSRFAKRVLKPNGFCVAYSGQMYLPEVMKRMSEHLDYYWTFAVYHEGQTQIVNGINLRCRWKPVLIFQNGKKKIENTFQDYFISEQREKTGHDWQQSKSGVAYLIEMFTKPNDLILEPFAGSGTTIIVAREKKRRIMASEINEQTYNIAKAAL